MVAYTGIETISNMAEEARDYGKTIPRGIGLVVGAVAVIYTFLPAGGAVGHAGEERPDDPRAAEGAGRLRRRPGARRGEEHGPGLAASTRPRSTSASWRPRSCSSPRTPGSSACRGSATPWASTASSPSSCALLHPRFRTPYIAITVFSVIACVAIIPGQADFLGVIYAFGAMLSFTMAHAAVATLRVKQPDADRPWKRARHPQDPRPRAAALSRSSAASARGSR